ncbi:hypothetical protein [Cumulibacter manganitolerans]|uniref:hypothetical protein n=1 Tax=Cumulibacter manganitolerans TaxID=1884992 RepID=UPI001294EF18|nr:hypothetical protein [Cumulibacter manganitolerans]
MGVLRRIFRGRPPVPESAKQFLERDERALAWAQAVTGQILVASPRGLHVVGERAHRLIGWHEISKATWGERKLTVIEAKQFDGAEIGDERPWRLEFDEPGGIPVVLRQRVESSVVVTVHRKIGGGVRLIGRKVPGRDGLLWQYRFDRPGPVDPAVRAAVEAALADVRDEHTPRDL